MKYRVNQIVRHKNSNKKLLIKDFEIFEGLVLYYTNDNNAYPENLLEIDPTEIDKSLSGFIKIFELIVELYLKTQEKNLIEQKNRHLEVLKKLKNPDYIEEIKNKIKNHQI